MRPIDAFMVDINAGVCADEILHAVNQELRSKLARKIRDEHLSVLKDEERLVPRCDLSS